MEELLWAKAPKRAHSIKEIRDITSRVFILTEYWAYEPTEIVSVHTDLDKAVAAYDELYDYHADKCHIGVAVELESYVPNDNKAAPKTIMSNTV